MLFTASPRVHREALDRSREPTLECVLLWILSLDGEYFLAGFGAVGDSVSDGVADDTIQA